MTIPFGMTWARRVRTPDPPLGSYDPLTQRWSPSVVRNSVAPHETPLVEPSTLSTGVRSAVLIFAQRFDPHADVVIEALERLGVEAIRLNGDTLSTEWDVHWQPSEDVCQFSMRAPTSRQVRIPSEVISAYYRRPGPLQPHPALVSADARQFAVCESRALMDSLYVSLDHLWLSAPHFVERARAKIPQIVRAKQLGLRTPVTLVTNDAHDAQEFAEALRYDVITKPLHSATMEVDGSTYDFYTRRLTKQDFIHADEPMSVAPLLLQEYLPRSAEIRVTLIGDQAFGTEITSDPSDPTISDRRFESNDGSGATYRPYLLPEGVRKAALQLVRSMGLQSASIDFILTTDDELVFLELNPNGSWYWLELETGQPITAAMAKLLAAPPFSLGT